jgi:hypothetical protein
MVPYHASAPQDCCGRGGRGRCALARTCRPRPSAAAPVAASSAPPRASPSSSCSARPRVMPWRSASCTGIVYASATAPCRNCLLRRARRLCGPAAVARLQRARPLLAVDVGQRLHERVLLRAATGRPTVLYKERHPPALLNRAGAVRCAVECGANGAAPRRVGGPGRRPGARARPATCSCTWHSERG